MIHFPRSFLRDGRWLLRTIDTFALGFPYYVIAALTLAFMVGTVAAFLKLWRVF